MIRNETRRGYDAIANEYDGQEHATIDDFYYFSLKWLSSIKFPSLKKKELLDIGAGTCKTLDILTGLGQKEFKRFDVLDFSLNMIEVCRTKHSNLITNFYNYNVHNIDQLGHKYDYVFALLADPYLTDSFLSKLALILKPKGKVFISWPHILWAKLVRDPDVINIATIRDAQGNEYNTNSFARDPDEVVEVLKQNGFNNIKYVIYDFDLENSALKSRSTKEKLQRAGIKKVEFYVGLQATRQ